MEFYLLATTAEPESKVRCRVSSHKEIGLGYIGIRISCFLKTKNKDYCLLSKVRTQGDFSNVEKAASSAEFDITIPQGPVSQKTQNCSIYWVIESNGLKKDITILKPQKESGKYLNQFKIPSLKTPFKRGTFLHLFYILVAVLFIRKGIEVSQASLSGSLILVIMPFFIGLIFIVAVGISFSYYFNRIKSFVLWLSSSKNALFVLFNPYTRIKLSSYEVDRGKKIDCIVETRKKGKLKIKGIKITLLSQYLERDSFVTTSSYEARNDFGTRLKKGFVLPIYREKKITVNHLQLVNNNEKNLTSTENSPAQISMAIPSDKTIGSFLNEEQNIAVVNHFKVTIRGRLFTSYTKRIPLIVK